ncbi:MAG TPA: hypothetical protein VFR93_06455, partial [Candidatus Limnocylindrales bacterium]|nr:hypothetical protein [Candidatus Limnocylindrales bacterium]
MAKSVLQVVVGPVDRDPERDPRVRAVALEGRWVGTLGVVAIGKGEDVGEGPVGVVVDLVDVAGDPDPRIAIAAEDGERGAPVAQEMGRPEAADPAVHEDPVVVLEAVPDDRLARRAAGVGRGDGREQGLREEGAEAVGQGGDAGGRGHRGVRASIGRWYA